MTSSHTDPGQLCSGWRQAAKTATRDLRPVEAFLEEWAEYVAHGLLDCQDAPPPLQSRQKMQAEPFHECLDNLAWLREATVANVAADDAQLAARIRQTFDRMVSELCRDDDLDPAERDWQRSPELLQAVLNASVDAFLVTSLDGTIRLWNRAAETMFGIARNDMLGQPLEAHFPAERLDEAAEMLESIRQGQALSWFDTARVRPSGETVPVSVAAFPVRDSKGEIIAGGIVERDVTDRLAASDALREALAQAESANEAQSRFLANVSHELRTPMNAIVGMTALALEEDISPELREYLETIRDSADSLVGLVNNVLDLSKFESGMVEAEEDSFQISQLVESAVRNLASAAYQKGLELACHVDPGVPTWLRGDAVRIRQIITNLVSNAIKFTDAGEVLVEVGARPYNRRDVQLTIKVSDTGIGISEELQRDIFKPFVQADNTSTRRHGGTGLGLAITSRLVEFLSGSIELKSKQGEGSTFAVRLLLGLDSTRLPSPSEKATPLGGKTALVVDDNQTARSVLADQLSHWGLDVVQADSGAAALRKLDTLQPDEGPLIALVDAIMPGMDGFELVEHLAATPRKVRIVLLASTSDRLTFSTRCAESGAHAFLTKPVSNSQLLDTLLEVTGASIAVEEKRSSATLAATASPLRILLVEDTPANRKVVHRVLAKRGHTVAEAINGREAVDLFLGEVFDVILMDVQMPTMDGLQATEQIRQYESQQARQPIPIIAMTAHTSRGDRRKCLDAGMNAYLAKPLDVSELVETVESAVVTPTVRSTEGQVEAAPATGETSERAGAAFSGEDAPADLEAALERLLGDRGLMQEMATLFLDDHARLLVEVEASAAANSSAALTRAAHSLKGLAANFNAKEAVALSAKVEDLAGRDEHVPGSLLEELKAAITRLADYLRRECADRD